MNTTTTGLLSGLILSLSLIPSLHAAEQADTVIVTATRTAQTVDETLASVSVITREDIEASQAQDVIDLLRLQAGVDVTRYGGPGTGASVFLRGTGSDQVLVLIDGVRVASATTGAFAWSTLSLSDVERIEIVRGPDASVYGSDAIGGVIQIFTRRNDRAYVRGQVGSYASKLVEAGLGGGKTVRYSLNVSSRAADGFSATNDKNTFSYNPDNDGYRQRSASGDLRFDLGKKAKLKIGGWYSDGYTEFDAGATQPVFSNSTNSALNLRLDHHTTSAWSQNFRLGWAADDIDTVSSFPSFIRTRRWTADWQHDLTLGETALLTMGLSAIRDTAKNIDTATDSIVFDESVDTNAAYALLQTTLGRHDLQFSGRVDDYSSFGSHTSGQIAWGMNAGKNRFTASAGTAFRAPTLNELYHPGFFGFYAGNPDLKPETSLNLELGLRHRFDAHRRLTASVYRNTIDDLIAYQGTNNQAINIAEARIDGFELTYTLQQARWSAQASLTLQKAIDTDTGQDLVRRPREKFALQIQRQTATGGSYGLEWLFAGKRHDAGTVLAPYHLINLSARTPLEKNLWLEGRIENLLDTDYELIYGYNTAGLSAYVGVKYDFVSQ